MKKKRLKKKRIKLAARFLEKKIIEGENFVENIFQKSKKNAKFATTELAKLLNSLGETELTKH